jgi:hypothetical protein
MINNKEEHNDMVRIHAKNFVSEKAQHMRGMINNNNKQADKDMVRSHAEKTCFRKSSTYKAWAPTTNKLTKKT